jgi:hypothetical protein
MNSCSVSSSTSVGFELIQEQQTNRLKKKEEELSYQSNQFYQYIPKRIVAITKIQFNFIIFEDIC